MTESTDRSLEDEARALLGAVREPLPASPEVKARALRRLMLALPPPGGDGGGGGSAPTSPPVKLGLGRALATRVPAWSLLASFVAGGAAVLMATRVLPAVPATTPAPSAPSAEPMLPVAPVVAATAEAPAPSIPAPVLPTAPTPPDHTARAASSIPAPRASADGLEAERAMLDVARTALVRGDGANALHAAEEHGRRFPRGILAEEREAMIIQALRLLHRDDAAEARLDRFRSHFPTSLMRPALEATDGGTP